VSELAQLHDQVGQPPEHAVRRKRLGHEAEGQRVVDDERRGLVAIDELEPHIEQDPVFETEDLAVHGDVDASPVPSVTHGDREIVLLVVLGVAEHCASSGDW